MTQPLAQSKLRLLLLLVVAGLLFSGYLSAVNLLSDTCAFNESCPFFLGYPACFYGFAMYLIMLFVAGLAVLGRINLKKAFLIVSAVSLVGILFSGTFVVQEILQSRLTGTLGLSTCAYGLILYASILLVSVVGCRPT